jgi:predicted Zn-dependent protease
MRIKRVEMIAFTDIRSGVAIALAVLLVVSTVTSGVVSALALPDSIELEDFRWDRFPLKVLVDMNEWSTPNYATAVREALDGWIMSIWAYISSYDGTPLRDISYEFYLSNVNSTSHYDVLITFTKDEMPPGSGTVGETIFRWDSATHEPMAPITINVTTYSWTASPLFVRDVAMHEFGHALGLGHASARNTSDGPELMYQGSSKNQVVYPSTLDVYALNMLYQGNFGQITQLPPSIPYKMLTNGFLPPPPLTPFWETSQTRYLIILALLLLGLLIGLALWWTTKKPRPEEPVTEPQPSMPPTGTEPEASGEKQE